MKKAIFFDIDGTLIDAGHGMTQMSDRVKTAIRRLQAAGHVVLLASGRPYAFLDEELKRFGFDGYVLMNGAAVMIGDEVVYKRPMRVDFVKRICAVCEAHGVEYILQGVKHVYLKAEFQKMRQFYNKLKIPMENFMDQFDPEAINVYKMEFAATDAAGKAICRSFVTEDMTFMEDPHLNNNFELYSRKETKASGALHALQRLKIPVSASYAFGDGENDLEILDAVGCSFAMGNGHETAKAAADHIVASVHDDGVAEGIERYILA